MIASQSAMSSNEPAGVPIGTTSEPRLVAACITATLTSEASFWFAPAARRPSWSASRSSTLFIAHAEVRTVVMLAGTVS